MPEQAYVDRLLADLANDYALSADPALRSIFIGGGTPSLFSADAITRLLSGVADITGVDLSLIEVTMEANPGTFEQERFKGFRTAGINRLSIGIQSFDPLQLTNLGRIHSASEAERAIAMAREAGFDNINLDLMFGLPGQTHQDALQDLAKAISFEPNHISWYQLTIEPNTAFYSTPPTLPDDDIIGDMHDAGLALLANHGFEQYEVSAFARQNRRSVHNQIYWRFDDYIGIGAGAHGKLTVNNQVYRTQRTRLPTHYLAASASENKQRLVPNQDLAFEYMLNRLRLREAFNPNEITSLINNQSVEALEAAIDQAISRRLLERNNDLLSTTDLGWKHLNALLTLFLTE